MITPLNRKELVITFSLKKQAEIRAALSQNNIDYVIKTINRKSPSPFSAGMRARTGTFGEKSEMANEYIFYVKKEDFEEALHCIQV